MMHFTSHLKRGIAVGLSGLALAGCMPAEPPPALLKTQKDALDSAKTIDRQLQQQQDKMKAAEEAQN